MNTSRKKIYFASDAHLGARFHKDPLAVEKKLVRWLDSIKDEARQAGRIIGQRHRNPYFYR